jgi:CheY-like chemotaxis protein
MIEGSGDVAIGQKPVVLIIDDDPDIREPLSLVLPKCFGDKFSVMFAATAEGAREKIKKNWSRIKAIVFDMNIPRVPGEDPTLLGIKLIDEVMGSAEYQNECPKKVIIGFSGDMAALQELKAKGKGIVLVNKPCGPLEFGSIIAEQLGCQKSEEPRVRACFKIYPRSTPVGFNII